ncbi:hypothetical protein ABW19_dt0203529 [Dactylella cylindrospora]|nr:hypothetical protein ABW19_dt0203529 [Dactylella cylindrospora]
MSSRHTSKYANAYAKWVEHTEKKTAEYAEKGLVYVPKPLALVSKNGDDEARLALSSEKPQDLNDQEERKQKIIEAIRDGVALPESTDTPVTTAEHEKHQTEIPLPPSQRIISKLPKLKDGEKEKILCLENLKTLEFCEPSSSNWIVAIKQSEGSQSVKARFSREGFDLQTIQIGSSTEDPPSQRVNWSFETIVGFQLADAKKRYFEAVVDNFHYFDLKMAGPPVLYREAGDDQLSALKKRIDLAIDGKDEYYWVRLATHGPWPADWWETIDQLQIPAIDIDTDFPTCPSLSVKKYDAVQEQQDEFWRQKQGPVYYHENPAPTMEDAMITAIDTWNFPNAEWQQIELRLRHTWDFRFTIRDGMLILFVSDVDPQLNFPNRRLNTLSFMFVWPKDSLGAWGLDKVEADNPNFFDLRFAFKVYSMPQVLKVGNGVRTPIHYDPQKFFGRYDNLRELYEAFFFRRVYSHEARQAVWVRFRSIKAVNLTVARFPLNLKGFEYGTPFSTCAVPIRKS